MRFWLYQAVGVVALWVAYSKGWLALIYDGDPTRLSVAIAGLALVALVPAIADDWRVADFIAPCLPLLGLFGTLVGMQAVFSLDEAQIRAALGTAFYTTQAGIIGTLWLTSSKFIAGYSFSSMRFASWLSRWRS